MPDHDATLSKIADLAAGAGLRSVTMLAWRDLDDPEAGGSEIHASTVAKTWAEAGLEVTMRTSHAPGHPQVADRDGYRVIRKAGRYLVSAEAEGNATLEVPGWPGLTIAVGELWKPSPLERR